MIKAAFRVDAGLSIGAGHLMRCIALADELKKNGAFITFICQPCISDLEKLITNRGYGLIKIETNSFHDNSAIDSHWLKDAQETKKALSILGGVDWLVVDHYGIDAKWEKFIRPMVNSILVIDDLANRTHDCELLLDQNLHIDGSTRYKNYVSKDVRQLIGPGFALLRQEFIDVRSVQTYRDGVVRRLLIFFGGVDLENLTSHLLADISSCFNTQDLIIDVVLGAACPHVESVALQCEKLSNVIFHYQTNNIAQLMATADLAIGGAGTAVWERCAIGVPSIIVPIADNQLPGLRAIGESGCAFVATESLVDVTARVSAIIAALKFAMLSPTTLRHQSIEAANLVDANGCSRVVREMGFPKIQVRRATKFDSELIYAWRNHQEIREQSLNSQQISLPEHLAWMNKVLTDEQIDLLICEDDDGPCGVLRYEHCETHIEVSIYRVPGSRGRGIGGLILKSGEDWLRRFRLNSKSLEATVLSSNSKSFQMFDAAGYTVVMYRYKKRLH